MLSKRIIFLFCGVLDLLSYFLVVVGIFGLSKFIFFGDNYKNEWAYSANDLLFRVEVSFISEWIIWSNY